MRIFSKMVRMSNHGFRMGRSFVILLGLAVVFAAAPFASAQSVNESTVFEVHAGDTFSALAARITGEARTWSKVYNRELSGLPNPDLILVGMRMELATAPSGQKYLRVVSPRPAALAKATTAKVALAAPAPAQQAATPAPAASIAARPAGSGAADEALVIGILPNIGPAALMAQYESLKTYLERTTQQKVRIVLPSNFKAFLDSTMRGEYDLAVAAPHFARVAQIDRGMVPLVMYEPRINALFLTPTDSALRSSADVRGKAIAFANPQSLVAMYGQQWLRQQNLEGGKDYEIKAANSDMGVGRMVLSGDAVAAIMSNGEFRSLPPDESSRMKIVETFARIPNFIVIGHPRLGTARLAQLKTQLKQFVADKDEGQAFLKATGLTGMTDVDDATLRELDTYVGLTRRSMGYGN
jgi:phosphonate transport system substrate-binding protein